MPTYSLNFVNADPFFILNTTPGNTSTWSGPSTADGTAVITDNNTGADGLVLDSVGESATADLTLGGTSVTGVTVSALEAWTLRNTSTGEEFQVVTFNVPGGSPGRYFTLTEVPLVNGQSYETVAFSNNANTANGDPAFSYADYYANTAAVDGTAGDDTIDAGYTDAEGDAVDDGNSYGATGNDDYVDAGAGNDSVASGAGSDTVLGGAGDDTITGGAGDDSLDGGADNDTLYDGLGADTLIGGAGNDLLVSQNGGDTAGQAQLLEGGIGDDTIRVEGDFTADDTITGGAGTDELQLLPGDDRDLTVDMAAGTSTDGGSAAQVFSGIENITTGGGYDTILGDGAANVLDGGSGNDSISGGAGDDTLIGGTEGLGSGPLLVAVTETFDGGSLAGWALDDPADGTLTGDAAGGTDGAGGLVFDDAQGFDEYLVAPTSFLDNFPSSGTVLSGSFSFDVQIGSDTDLIDSAVQITGNGQTITLPATVQSGQTGSFQTITVDLLDAGAAGVTEAELQAILTDVTDLRFQVDFNTGFPTGDAVGLDNIALSLEVGGLGSDTLDGGAGEDSIQGGDGDDSLIGGTGSDTIEGGDGADTILGEATSIDTRAVLDWSLEGGDGTNVAGGFTQDTGDVEVAVSFSDDGNNAPTFTIETTDTQYVDGGEEYDTNSSLFLFGTGDGATSTTTLDFAASVGADVEDEVQNVAFRLNDIDFFDGNHRDIITVIAIDADGNPVTVTLTPEGNDTVAGNTITAGDSLDGPQDAAGSVLVEIAGPVSQVQIVYTNGLTGTQGVNVTDVYFDTIPTAASTSDVIDGGAGADSIDGMLGDDTITGGAGDDTITGGAGEDVFVLTDGFGADVITDFSTGDTDGDGFYNDQLDVTNLQDAQGNPVNAWDVVVSDDGAGNALLTFPNNETLILQGVAPAEVTGAQLLNAAGIPCFADGTRIRTPQGEVPIEALQVGDLVETLEHGPQPILWAGQRHLGPRELMAFPQHRPITIPEGVLGNYAPLVVSPLHGMLLGAEHLGEELLVRAKHLAEAQGPVRVAKGKRKVTYHHLLLGQHQILFANGALAESFYPGPFGLEMYPEAEVAKIQQALPGLGTEPVEACYGPTARRFARRKEVLSGVDLRHSRRPHAFAAE